MILNSETKNYMPKKLYEWIESIDNALLMEWWLSMLLPGRMLEKYDSLADAIKISTDIRNAENGTILFKVIKGDYSPFPIMPNNQYLIEIQIERLGVMRKKERDAYEDSMDMPDTNQERGRY